MKVGRLLFLSRMLQCVIFFLQCQKKSLFSGQADVGILSIRWPFKDLAVLLSVWSMARQNKIFFIPAKTPLVLLMFTCCHSCPGVDRWKRGSQPALNGPLGPPPNIPLPFMHCEFHPCAVQIKKSFRKHSPCCWCAPLNNWLPCLRKNFITAHHGILRLDKSHFGISGSLWCGGFC